MTTTDIHDGPPCRYVITGGPSAGKEAVIESIIKVGLPCSPDEAAREIYRRHRARLGRHLRREDRRDYSREVLRAFIAEFQGQFIQLPAHLFLAIQLGALFVVVRRHSFLVLVVVV
jgi:predicted ATPase